MVSCTAIWLAHFEPNILSQSYKDNCFLEALEYYISHFCLFLELLVLLKLKLPFNFPYR